MNNRARYLKAEANVRYWEDVEFDGDIEDFPLSDGDMWCATIDLKEGRVLDWPAGVKADVHFKVCDSGSYWLLDEDKNTIAKIENHYVPNGLCHGDSGYGDYIIMKIDSEGKIAYFNNDVDVSEWDLVVIDESEIGDCPMCKRLIEERNTFKSEVDRLKEEYE